MFVSWRWSKQLLVRRPSHSLPLAPIDQEMLSAQSIYLRKGNIAHLKSFVFSRRGGMKDITNNNKEGIDDDI